MAIQPKAPPTSTTLTITIADNGAISGSLSGAVKGPVSGTATLPPGPPGPAGPPGPDLTNRVAALEQQVASLDARVTALESGTTPIPPEPEPIPPTGPVKDFVADFGAQPAPADAGPAVQRWLTFAQANPNSTLMIPAGDWRLNSGPQGALTSMCKNATILGSTTGVTKLNRLYMGTGNNMPCGFDTSGRIATVAAGSNTVTLINDADAAKFAVGNWVMVGGLSLMIQDSYPLNLQYFEYHKITGKSGKELTLDAPLRHAYKSTWPLVRPGVAHFDYGGPGTIYKATWDDIFDNTSTFRNLWIEDPGDGYPNVFQGTQRRYIVENCTFVDEAGSGISTWNPSACVECINRNCTYKGGVVEVDKLVTYLEFDNCQTESTSVNFQSASIDQVVFKNCRGSISGVPRNARIENCDVDFSVGPAFFGACEGVTITNSNLRTLSVGKRCNYIADWQWTGNGIFRIAKNSSNITLAYQYVIPGFRWAQGNYQDGVPAGYVYPLPGIYPDDGSPVIDFLITDFTDDANYAYMHTDCSSWPPPSKTYSGEQPSVFHLYGVKQLTQSGTTAPGDLKWMAEP
jgi:hypothetical protein